MSHRINGLRNRGECPNMDKTRFFKDYRGARNPNIIFETVIERKQYDDGQQAFNVRIWGYQRLGFHQQGFSQTDTATGLPSLTDARLARTRMVRDITEQMIKQGIM